MAKNKKKTGIPKAVLDQKANQEKLDSLLSGEDVAKAATTTQPSRNMHPTTETQLGIPSPKKRHEFQKQIKELSEQIDIAQKERDQSDLIIREQQSQIDDPVTTMVMPVSKISVDCKERLINPELIDVHPLNDRIPELLDAISLSDILPKIREFGQQVPGLVQPKNDGSDRYWLVYGSRRLASINLLNKESELSGDTFNPISYKALVGAIPNVDVKQLSDLENISSNPSHYEKAKSYEAQIGEGKTYKNWEQLGAAFGLSKGQISRYKALCGLDLLFIKILRAPQDMTLKYGSDLAALFKKGREAVCSEAATILSERESGKSYDFKDIMLRLKTSVKADVFKQIDSFSSENKKVKAVHTVNDKGNYQVKIKGLTDDQITGLKGYINSEFGLLLD